MNLNRLFRTSLICGPLFVAACGDDTSDVGDDGDGTTSGSATDTNGQVTLTTMPATTGPTTDPDPDTTVGDTTIGEDDTTTGEDTDGTTTDVDPDGTTTGDTDGTTTGDTEDTETTGANGCAQITVSNFTPGSFIFETTDVDPNIGGADPEVFRFEFYSPATGSFDLGAGVNDNYATCDQCLRLFEDVTQDDIARQYFQQSGTIDIDASSDVGGGVLVATLTDVTLIEVTVDPNNGFESTPVPDGACIQLNTQNVSVVPNNSCEGAMLCGVADPVPGSFPNCYCDELCFANNDCCPDVCEPNACGAEPFCDDAGDVENLEAGPGLAQAVPDDAYDGSLGSMACQSFTVDPGGAETVSGVSLTLGMNHTWIGDVTIKVESPAGTVVTAMSRPGYAEPADDGTGCCGDSSDLSSSFPVSFFDNGTHDAELMGSTIGASAVVCEDDGWCDYFPNPGAAAAGDFSSFAGETAVGTWQVCVGDSGFGDLGTIDYVGLTIQKS